LQNKNKSGRRLRYTIKIKGVVLDKLGNHTGAIENYDKALVINPKYENASRCHNECIKNSE
jgi:tetratricopeptide (TPR) repeat protein